MASFWKQLHFTGFFLFFSSIFYCKFLLAHYSGIIFRNMLSAVEAPGAHVLRLTLCRQLAEILLRGIVRTSYVPPPGKQIWQNNYVKLETRIDMNLLFFR